MEFLGKIGVLMWSALAAHMNADPALLKPPQWDC